MADDDEHEQGGEEYDPYQYVPDRIDILSADGLVQMHEALNDENAARLRAEDPEVQAVLFWDMVETGVITPTIDRRGTR